MVAASARVKNVPVQAPDGHEMKMLVLDRSNKAAPIGQFFVRRNFQAILRKEAEAGQGQPRGFVSFADAKTWIEKKVKRVVEFTQVATAGTNAMPVGWFATTGRDTYEIAYAGSMSYPDGRPIDPMTVGTPDEIRHASNG